MERTSRLFRLVSRVTLASVIVFSVYAGGRTVSAQCETVEIFWVQVSFYVPGYAQRRSRL